MKRILLYNPAVLWHYFITDIELASKHLAEGDEVHFLNCRRSLSFCETNKQHKADLCNSCIALNESALDYLKIPTENRHELQLYKYFKEIEFPEFSSIRDLKAYEADGIDIGSMAASSLISALREPKPDMKRYRGLVNLLLLNALAVYESVYALLEKLQPDIFYIFSSRYMMVRPALRAAQRQGIKCLVHNSAVSPTRYILTETTYTHDLEYCKKELESYWAREPDYQLKVRAAREWYFEKRMGKKGSVISFTGRQTRNKLPDNFDRKKINIAIYTSSEDEHEAIDAWADNWYSSQNEVISYISRHITTDNFHFYIRLHPNIGKFNNSSLREVFAIKADNLTVIPPGSEIDTYSLIDACAKIITFGSTVGIEANFWEKPSILIGKAYYEDLGSCYRAENYDDLINLITQDLKPLEREGAFKYAYYEKVRGIDYSFTSPSISYGDYLPLLKKASQETDIAKLDLYSVSFSGFFTNKLRGKDAAVIALTDRTVPVNVTPYEFVILDHLPGKDFLEQVITGEQVFIVEADTISGLVPENYGFNTWLHFEFAEANILIFSKVQPEKLKVKPIVNVAVEDNINKFKVLQKLEEQSFIHPSLVDVVLTDGMVSFPVIAPDSDPEAVLKKAVYKQALFFASAESLKKQILKNAMSRFTAAIFKQPNNKNF